MAVHGCQGFCEQLRTPMPLGAIETSSLAYPRSLQTRVDTSLSSRFGTNSWLDVGARPFVRLRTALNLRYERLFVARHLPGQSSLLSFSL